MHLKQWNAIVELVAQALTITWVLLSIGTAKTLTEVAALLLWGGGLVIALSIVGAITVSILRGIAQRDGRREDRADERDRTIYAKALRNAYFPSSITALAVLIVFALGWDPISAAYMLFFGGMLAGAVGSISQLVYYRVG